MDSKRNLIAYHDVSFAGTVYTDDLALSTTSNQAIESYEWITRSGSTRKLDDSKLLKLRRVIPNSFTFEKSVDNITYLKISKGASLADSSVVVSSFHKVISEIQAVSASQFGNKTAVNIFLDAAKTRDITIAAINRLRRSQLIADGKIYNDINDAHSVPSIGSIAVQFRINHFPNGAEDLAQALCSSSENDITYKKSVVKIRNQVYHPRNWLRYKDETRISYSDSTDNFSNSYGSSITYSATYGSAYTLRTGVIYNNGNPAVRLWGDAASGTCNTSHIENSGIAVVPVVEEILPFKVNLDGSGDPTYPNAPIDFAKGIMNFLNPFKKYFKMNIIEFSYTPLDKVSYYSSDAKQVVNTDVNSLETYFQMASKATDSVFQNQKYIYQTFNRFFDLNFIKSTAGYDGMYLCSAQAVAVNSYAYLCNTQSAGSLDEQKFEYRAKPGFYTGVCNMVLGTQFRALPFGLTTTDNLMLETYLQGMDFQNNRQLLADFCSTTNDGNRMSDYTTRYKSFVGNPSFRLSGGI